MKLKRNKGQHAHPPALLWVLGVAAIAIIAIQAALSSNIDTLSAKMEEPTPSPILQQTTSTPTPKPTIKPTPSPTPSPTPVPDPYVIAWISDTQGYAQYRPEIFYSMTQWIANEHEREHIQYVIHTGDIVDDYDVRKQWERADEAMGYLDGVVPYFTLAGNHDIGSGKRDYDYYLEYFGEERFADQETFGGTYRGGWGRYDIINIYGQDILIASVGYNVNERSINWLNEVLATYADTPAILCFHGYMNPDGSFTTDGKRLYPEVVATNPNVRMVLCGHERGVARHKAEFDDDGDGKNDRTVYQLLSNYQREEMNGGGYMSLMTFRADSDFIEFIAYSPYLDDYNHYDDVTDRETFVIPWVR